MMILAWHRTLSGVMPVLHYVQLSAKGEGDPGTQVRILQHNRLTDEQERELDRMPDGVSRVDAAAKTFPFKPKIEAVEAVDTGSPMDMLNLAIDTAVDDYRRRMRAKDGQTAHIDRDWNK
jgi:ABC-type cobalamin transport system ATPase subunit